jgi:hypothetical protein
VIADRVMHGLAVTALMLDGLKHQQQVGGAEEASLVDTLGSVNRSRNSAPALSGTLIER